MENADVVVIGAGIMGAAIAHRLSEAGLRVTVLEARESPATASTGRSAAGVRVQFSEEVNIRLSWESIEEYRNFLELYGEDSGYREQGYLFLVPRPHWEAHVRALALQRRVGVPVRELRLAEAQEIVPFDEEGLAGATFGPSDGVVDPHSITMTYLRLARENGTQIRLNTPVTSASRKGSSWRLVTPTGELDAPVVVNAAGAWAGRVARFAGLELPIEPARRTVYVTAPLPYEHLYPLTVDISSGFYFRSEGRRIIFGRSNPDEELGFTEGVDWSWLEPTLDVGLKRFPWLAGASLDRRACWWGYYEITPDHNPILGRMPGVEGWLNAAGFSGHGVQQAAMVGRLMAEEVVSGHARSLDIDALRYERFAKGNRRNEQHIV